MFCFCIFQPVDFIVCKITISYDIIEAVTAQVVSSAM